MSSNIYTFDIDGTLFDTKPGIISALNEVLQIYGKAPILCDENKYIGPPINFSLLNFFSFSEHDADVAAGLYRKIYVEKYICYSELYPCIYNLIKELKNKNNKIYIASMKTKIQVDRLLEIYGLENFFDGIYCGKDDGSLNKKDMLSMIRSMNDTIDKFVMIGDHESDYLAAKKNGFVFISADYGYGDIADKPDCFHVTNSAELFSLLHEQNISI